MLETAGRTEWRNIVTNSPYLLSTMGNGSVKSILQLKTTQTQCMENLFGLVTVF